MSLLSIEFFLCFLPFVIIYNLANEKIQNILLCVFSLSFIYLLSAYVFSVFIIFCLFTHFLALLIYTRNNVYIYTSSSFALLLFLSFFKYYESIKDSLDYLLSLLHLNMNVEILFVVGLSFYTFNALTYLSAIYNKKQYPISLFNLITYLGFFAIFTSGPIFRFSYFNKQFLSKKRFMKINLILSLLLFALVKMLVLRNIFEDYFLSYLENKENLSILGLIICFYFYSFMLYCDFSAYVNLVSALALMLGIKLPKNFNNPFKAINIQDFWRRWHISLSLFIKDFIYIKLGGSRCGFFRTKLNIIIAFALSGLWHGNTINFLFWGLAHAFALCVVSSIKFRFFPLLSMFVTFTYISLTWSFFYFASFDEFLQYYECFFLNNKVSNKELITFLIICAYLIFNFYSKNLLALLCLFFKSVNIFVKIIIVILVLTLVFIFMPNGIPNFIYAGF